MVDKVQKLSDDVVAEATVVANEKDGEKEATMSASEAADLASAGIHAND